MWVFAAINGEKELVNVGDAVFFVPELRCSLEPDLGERLLTQMGLGTYGKVSLESYPHVRQQLLRVENSARFSMRIRDSA